VLGEGSAPLEVGEAVEGEGVEICDGIGVWLESKGEGLRRGEGTVWLSVVDALAHSPSSWAEPKRYLESVSGWRLLEQRTDGKKQ
jgi:hypothetical protein